MTEIYWMQVVGNLSDLIKVAMIIAICFLIILTIGYCATEVYNDDDRAKLAAVVKWLKRSAVAVIVSAVGMAFIPSDKELMAIYGIGGTIDYIKSNDKAKELPDKCIDALTRYVDSIEKENKDNNN